MGRAARISCGAAAEGAAAGAVALMGAGAAVFASVLTGGGDGWEGTACGLGGSGFGWAELTIVCGSDVAGELLACGDVFDSSSLLMEEEIP